MQQQINKEKEIESLNIQILFISAVIIALILSIYILEGYKDIIINGRNAKHTQKELQDYAIIVSFITTTTALYFLYLAFKNYKNQNTTANSLYLIAAILIAIATVLGFMTLVSTPFEDESANEII